MPLFIINDSHKPVIQNIIFLDDLIHFFFQPGHIKHDSVPGCKKTGMKDPCAYISFKKRRYNL